MALRPLLLSLLAAAVFAFGVFIGHANAGSVRFDYLLGTIDLSLIAVLMIAFGFGVLLTLVIVALRLLSLRAELRRLRRHLRDAEAELRNLRNLPVGHAGSSSSHTVSTQPGTVS